MKKSISLALATSLAAVACQSPSSGPVEATWRAQGQDTKRANVVAADGRCLKHLDTEITNPSRLQLTTTGRVWLEFDWSAPNAPLTTYKTDGTLVTPKQATSTPIHRDEPYAFRYSNGRIEVRRHQSTSGIALLLVGNDGPHTATGAPYAYDLRPDIYRLSGNLVLEVPTKTLRDPTPRRRLYRIDVTALEPKLP
jgi:hypothetical protein